VRILLTNDDGIMAPGLAAMYRALSAIGDVSVVAPESGQSASAHSITIRYPLMSRTVHVNSEFWGHSVEGSPADCVKLAFHALLDHRPDLVISGINAGENVGIHVLYSGTVAAAAEGALQGCRAIAVSLEYSDELDFDRAAGCAMTVIRKLLATSMTPGQLVSVNIPELRPGWPRGIRVVRQSVAPLPESFEQRTTPMGRPYYWLSGTSRIETAPAETDLKALREGYVTVTPLHVDLTHQARLEELSQIQWPQLSQPD
jgi:5'-nucleotidase